MKTILHTECQTAVRFETRTVNTRPNDQCWPKNIDLELPYCPRCKRLLNHSETARLFEL